MAPLAEKASQIFHYADCLTWPDAERWEIIEGVPYDMTPAPASDHQLVLGEIFGNIWQYLKNRSCKVFMAPFDVRLSEDPGADDNNIETVVQPDIVVICDQGKIDKRGCHGAPDITVEILSPTTAYKDETEKLRLYEKYGVREYWIVNPAARYIMVYGLNGEGYGRPEYFTKNDRLVSHVLPDFVLELTSIWDNKAGRTLPA